MTMINRRSSFIVLSKTIALICFFASTVSAATFYVSPSGLNTNEGTIQNPFATLQQAASVMKPGDVCYLREGRYHEALVLENLRGLPGSPIVFTAYKGEQVVLDGSEVIDAEWSVHEGNIYKARIESDIWRRGRSDSRPLPPGSKVRSPPGPAHSKISPYPSRLPPLRNPRFSHFPRPGREAARPS